MLKNVALKRALKNYFFPALTLINKFIPKNDRIILLYSANGGINNSLVPLRKLLLDYSYDNKYKIYCGVENLKFADGEKKVTYITHLQSMFLYFRTKHVFYTTGQIPIKPTNSQRVIQLGHGITDFKTGAKLSKIGNGDEFFFSYIAVSSDLYAPIYSVEYECPLSRVKPIGDVLADQLLKYPRKRTCFLSFSKLLVWFPTYRKSDYLGDEDSSMESLVPMFEESDYPELNAYLEKYNIKLVIKTHPAQTNIGGGKRHFSNLDVYTHDEFVNDGLNVYSLFAQSDGMVGDYSSMSLHALLIDIPLAFVVPDLEEYRRKRGFIFKDPTEYMCGDIIKTSSEFFKFIDDFAAGVDNYKDERHRIRDVIFKYQDGKTCERALALSGITL